LEQEQILFAVIPALRLHCRRRTRLRNAFGKKLENFEAAGALNFAYYNFVKSHGAIGMTPAPAAGVENSARTVLEIPPAKSAVTAVRVQIVKDAQGK
jgi:hypothetical protein